jgi:predicted metallopeptidase
MIRYEKADDVKLRISEIVAMLDLGHVRLDRVACVRSRGSKSRRTLARCHTLSKIIQKALGIPAHYVIEVISERFDSLPEEDKTKILIHEVLHIPKSFGGGFKYHDYVNSRAVNRAYDAYLRNKNHY